MIRDLSMQWRARVIVTALICALIICFAWPMTAAFMDRQADIAAARARLIEVRERRLGLAKSTVSMDASLPTPSGQGDLLTAATESEAHRQLEAYLRNTFRMRGGADILVQAISPAEEEGLSVLRAAVSARLPESGALEAIHGLEI